MSETQPQQFENVTVVCKANVYFDGRVISHTVRFADGTKKTIGTIAHGIYKFDTGSPERMDIIAGSCRVKIEGQSDWQTFAAGTFFKVPGHSFFEITVAEGITEYLCSFD